MNDFTGTANAEGPRRKIHRAFSLQANAKIPNRANYFGVEALVLLIGVTASLVVLPLVLPPLPPPPFMLLLLPIGILGLLVILAFMPYNVRDLTYTYM